MVDVPEETQLERTMARDDNDEAQVRRIMAAQMKRDEQEARRQLAVSGRPQDELLDSE